MGQQALWTRNRARPGAMCLHVAMLHFSMGSAPCQQIRSVCMCNVLTHHNELLKVLWASQAPLYTRCDSQCAKRVYLWVRASV